MQPDVRFLNGIWEGTSVPFRRDRESTRWVDCDFTFETSSVTGTGMSQWCGQNIPFRITGKFDASTATFEITKKHEGKFVNALIYRGRINFERRELRGQYRSGNFYLVQTSTRLKPLESKRVTIPRPITQGGQSLARLSGAWTGEYVSKKKGEVTSWRTCSLEFTLQTGQGQIGNLEGQGESLWRGEVIPFKLTGTFDLKRLRVELLKTHQGKYTNSGQYHMSLDLKHVQMTGDDGQGKLTLKKSFPHSGPSSSTSSTISSSMPGSPQSPPRDPTSPHSRGALSPSMPGLENYRRAMPNSNPKPPPSVVVSGGGGLKSPSPPPRIPSPATRSNSTTSVEDFPEKENNKTQKQQQQQQQVDTSSYDDFNSSSLEATRLKLGKLTNPTNPLPSSAKLTSEDYYALPSTRITTTMTTTTTTQTPKTIIENTPTQERLIFYLDGMITSTASSAIPASMIQDKRVTKDMYILSAKQSQAIADFRLKHKISEEDNKLVLDQLKVVDVFNSSLTTPLHSDKNQFFSREEETSPLPRPRGTYPSSGRLLSGASRGSITSDESEGVGMEPGEIGESGVGEQGEAQGYGDSMYGYGPTSTSTAESETEVPRDAYAFFEPEDESSSASSSTSCSLGSRDVPSPVSPTVEEESAELCKVCFDAKMNCVIIPCGHYSICMKCAAQITNCPVCRGAISQRQLVFRG